MINNVFIWISKAYTLLIDEAYIVTDAIIIKIVRKNSIIVGNPNKHVKINNYLYDDKNLQKILAYQK